MGDFDIDYHYVFRTVPERVRVRGPVDRHWADEMFSLADEDYLCYWLFSHATRAGVKYRRVALYHLSQALEKYLKCLYMARIGDLPRGLQHHDLEKLLGECRRVEPSLGSRSLVLFCRLLDNVVEMARYPDPNRPDQGFIRFTSDVDRLLQGIRQLAKDAIGGREKQLIERVLDSDGEWNPAPSAGWLTEAGVSLAEACRRALLTTHPGGVARPRTASTTVSVGQTRDDAEVATRVIAIDWSGARDGADKKIWLAEAEGERVLTLENGRDREEIAEHLIEAANQSPRLIVGLDFAFSLPSWFLEEQNLGTVYDLWCLAERDAEAWLAACEPPFWGRPGAKRPRMPDDYHFRRTDRDVPAQAEIRPKSVFQIGGAGAVGTGSLRGMPILRRLHDAGFSIWPFDPPGWPRVIEIWPRVLTGPVTKSSHVERSNYLRARHPTLSDAHFSRATGSDDAFDAAVSALKMAEHIDDLESLSVVPDPRIMLEGLIWHPGAGTPHISVQTPP